MSKTDTIIAYLIEHPWSSRSDLKRATGASISPKIRMEIERAYEINTRTVLSPSLRDVEQLRLRPLTETEIEENSRYYDPSLPYSSNIWNYIKFGN